MRLQLSSRITLKPDSASLPTPPRRTEILIPLSVRVAELLSRGSYGYPRRDTRARTALSHRYASEIPRCL